MTDEQGLGVGVNYICLHLSEANLRVKDHAVKRCLKKNEGLPGSYLSKR